MLLHQMILHPYILHQRLLLQRRDLSAVEEAMAFRDLIERFGLTQEQVAEIAGEPLSKELYSTDKLWFYYTNPKWYDGLVTQDECTPFLFDDDGVLLGWGNKYFRDQGIMSSWTQKAINSAVWF